MGFSGIVKNGKLDVFGVYWVGRFVFLKCSCRLLSSVVFIWVFGMM